MKLLSTITALIAVAFLSIAPANANISLVQDAVPITEAVCPDGSSPYTTKSLEQLIERLPGAILALEKEFPDGTLGVLVDLSGVEGYAPETGTPYVGMLFYSDTLSDGTTGWCWTGIVAHFTEQEAQDLWGLVKSDIY